MHQNAHHSDFLSYGEFFWHEFKEDFWRKLIYYEQVITSELRIDYDVEKDLAVTLRMELVQPELVASKVSVGKVHVMNPVLKNLSVLNQYPTPVEYSVTVLRQSHEDIETYINNNLFTY